MGAEAVKKTLVHSALAVILGLTIVLAPLVLLVSSQPQSNVGFSEALSTKFKEVERSTSEPDVEVFGLCFVIALVGYIFVRRKTSNRGFRRLGQGPYYF
jgi:branched-subunit amino acid ABC-type transport system permease component